MKFISCCFKRNSACGLRTVCYTWFLEMNILIVQRKFKKKQKLFSGNALLIDEFLLREFEKDKIKKSSFTEEKKEILFHGHCQQKALIGTDVTKKILSLPSSYSVKEIPSGCCGMAGSFGFEKEHYEISMKVGELVLFPEIREANNSTIMLLLALAADTK